jgi:hypothetical protein
MDVVQIEGILTKSGYHVLGITPDVLTLEDPVCIIRSLSGFIDFAWMALSVITVLLLFGWALAVIRGSKVESLVGNLKNLTLMFGGLAAIPGILSIMLTNDFTTCKKLIIPVSEINKLLESKEFELKIDMEKVDGDTPENDTESIYADEGAPEYNGDFGSEDSFTNMYRKAIGGQGNSVIFTLSDGSVVKKLDGTRAWRNNNPGNIRYGDFARNMGAIGYAGGFAVFPDEKTGFNAIKQLMQTEKYKKLTIFTAIHTYAPPFENNTAAYQRRVEQLTGISGSTVVSTLNDAQLSKVAKAIQTIEGWEPGKTIPIKNNI